MVAIVGHGAIDLDFGAAELNVLHHGSAAFVGGIDARIIELRVGRLDLHVGADGLLCVYGGKCYFVAAHGHPVLSGLQLDAACFGSGSKGDVISLGNS